MNTEKRLRKIFTKVSNVERKCDIILSQLVIMRERINAEDRIGNAIEKMHRAAKQMRMMSKREVNGYKNKL